MTTSEFDVYAANYRETVETSVGFTGRDLDFFTGAKAHHLLDVAQRRLGPLWSRSALDVGCGTGATDPYLLRHFQSVHGVDSSPQMVAEAAAANPDAHYRAYDGETLPYDDSRFDVVFAICVLHHVPPARWDAFVAEMARVTRPGGLTMIFEHNPLNPLTRRAVNQCPFDADAVLMGPRTVRAAMRAAGAARVWSRYILFSPLEATWAREIERPLGWCPLGGQYVVVAQSPSI